MSIIAVQAIRAQIRASKFFIIIMSSQSLYYNQAINSHAAVHYTYNYYDDSSQVMLGDAGKHSNAGNLGNAGKHSNAGNLGNAGNASKYSNAANVGIMLVLVKWVNTMSFIVYINVARTVD